MTTQYIKLKDIINKNTQQVVCSQYNNKKVDYAKSIIKIGEPLTQKLWNSFFATQVVPLRQRLFPKVQKLIEEQKGITNNRSKQDKKPTNHKKANYGKGNHRPAWE